MLYSALCTSLSFIDAALLRPVASSKDRLWNRLQQCSPEASPYQRTVSASAPGRCSDVPTGRFTFGSNRDSPHVSIYFPPGALR